MRQGAFLLLFVALSANPKLSTLNFTFHNCVCHYVCDHLSRAKAHRLSCQVQVSCKPDNAEVCIQKGSPYQRTQPLYCEDNHDLGSRVLTAAVLICAESMGMLSADDGAGPSGSQSIHPDADWTPFQVYAHSLKASLCMCDSVKSAINLSFEGRLTRHFCPSLFTCKSVSWSAEAQLGAWALYRGFGCIDDVAYS